jgi:hypothetical protein
MVCNEKEVGLEPAIIGILGIMYYDGSGDVDGDIQGDSCKKIETERYAQKTVYTIE